LSRFLSVLCLVSALFCAVSATAVATERIPMMSVADVRPGMRGYGLTVFRGTEPERFDVEVIDVVHRFRPDQDLVLIRTPHPVLDQVHIVAGMSGSPVYLEGKLLGAYAYGWPFGNEPVAGVTPIENMLTEMRRPTRPDSFFGSRVASVLPRRGAPRSIAEGLPFGFDGGVLPDAFTAIRALRERIAPRPSSASGGLVPASTPLSVGGLPDDVVAMLDRELSPLGLEPVQAGGAGRGVDPSAPTGYVDGGAIAVQIVRGDISMSAIGTVTYVDSSGRLVAFGHPMLEQGELGLPVAIGRISHVMSSVQRSFKIGEAVRPLGSLIHDRQSAIVIDAHRQPATIPVTIRIRGIEGAPRTEWNVEVASHRAMTPVLTLAAIQAALKSTSADQTDVAFKAHTEMQIAGYGTIELDDEGATTAGASATPLSSLRAFSLFEVVYGNPFVESRIERVTFDIEFQFGRTVLTLIDARVPDSEVEPGDRVPVILTFRRFGQPDRIETVYLDVPERLAGQTIRFELKPASSIPRPVGRAESFAALIDYVRDAHPATELGVTVDLPGRSLAFPGTLAEDLPPSAIDALMLARATEGSSPYAVQSVSYVPMGAVIAGSTSVELRVAPMRSSRSLVR